ncbi:SDR family oxidoreductase [Gammaproteobacteria bacterium]|nr:SDR family oxidoreductase [Gammaproteobacteria bacterium]|tara:strand:+ start:80 stop:763 length:684 start_codon:yes stop_codon:yes gene_type:complete
MKKKIVLFGGSSGLALDLCQKLSNSFNIINVSSSSTNLNHKNIKEVKLNKYSEKELLKFLLSLSKKDEHIFLFMNGITDSKAFYKIDSEEISRIIKVNFELPVLITNLIVKNFILKKTKYVYFSSSRALLGDRGISLYSSTKSALKYFAKSLSLEYGQFNHFFYTISLGVFEKGLVKKVKKSELEKIIKRSALNSYVDIDELARAVNYISENDSATGSVLNIDNGYF